MPGKLFGTVLACYLLACALMALGLRSGEKHMLRQWAEGRVADAVPASALDAPAER